MTYMYASSVILRCTKVRKENGQASLHKEQSLKSFAGRLKKYEL